MDTSTIPHQLRQMWDTRPLRARHAPIAGVATGFARRYQVDVALVRAAFIGATVLGGLGVLAYIAGMFVLPKEPHAPYGAVEPERSGPPTFVLIIAAVMAVVFGGDLSSSWPGAGLISAALLLAGWYALHQRLPVPPPGTAITDLSTLRAPAGVGAWQPPTAQFSWQPVPTPQAPAETAAPSDTPAAAPAEAPTDQQAEPAQAQARVTEEIHPPRWDPLGAAPFAWDLPEPAAVNTPAPVALTPRSRVTPVTLGIALLTGAALALSAVVFGVAITPVGVAAALLGVVGAGLVVGAFRRSGHGLLAVAIPLAGFVIVGTLAQNIITGFADAPRGDMRLTVAQPTDLRDQYVLQAGTLQLDLRRLTLDHDRTLTTRVGLGETRIEVPENMNVTVHCSVSVGDAQCPDSVTPKPGAPTLTIDAQNNVGTVEVTRVR